MGGKKKKDNIFTSTTGEKMRWFVCLFARPFFRTCFIIKSWMVRHNISKQDPRFETIREYKDKHLGERVFIVATGPSLTVDDLEKLKNEYTISMNSIINIFDKTDFRPTYYTIFDGFVYRKLQHAQTLIDPEKVFIGVGNVPVRWNITPKELSEPEDNEIHLFHVERTVILPYLYHRKSHFRTKFSFDAYKEVYDGGTITYGAIQLAVYMGFREIYLLGVDHNYTGDKTHFGDSEYSGKAKDQQRAVVSTYRSGKAYECAREACEKNGIKIYNATRGGKLEVFERADFDSLF